MSCREDRLRLTLSDRAADAETSTPGWIAHEDTLASRAAALREALAAARARHPGMQACVRVRVLFDDRWSVWMSLQGAFWALAPAQRDALVRAHLAQQLGADPTAWRVSSHVTADGQGLSACALSQARASEILAAVEAAGLRPTALQPAWVDRLDRLAARVGKGVVPELVAAIDGELLCLALRAQDDWMQVGSLQVDRDADWSARALAWCQGLGRSADLSGGGMDCWFAGNEQDCPEGWSLLETV